MRSKVSILATRTAPDEVYCQLSTGDGDCFRLIGCFTMKLKEYRSFINTVVTGSGATGPEGCDISLQEEGFEQWN